MRALGWLAIVSLVAGVPALGHAEQEEGPWPMPPMHPTYVRQAAWSLLPPPRRIESAWEGVRAAERERGRERRRARMLRRAERALTILRR